MFLLRNYLLEVGGIEMTSISIVLINGREQVDVINMIYNYLATVHLLGRSHCFIFRPAGINRVNVKLSLVHKGTMSYFKTRWEKLIFVIEVWENIGLKLFPLMAYYKKANTNIPAKYFTKALNHQQNKQ